jgi:hypothetical protein
LKTSNLILDLEFDQHLWSHKHVINIIMWFRDMGRYKSPSARSEDTRARSVAVDSIPCCSNLEEM